RAIDFASYLGAEAVSFWSGMPDSNEDDDVYWNRLIEACQWLSEQAARRKVRLAFEPEPGMFIARMTQFDRLYQAVNSPWFGLTLDVGHLHCLADGDIPTVIRQWKNVLWNIHLEDMKPGVHEHLFFGEGTM
ncbi:MAG TPA: sugar phosphate isomerase/epimerase family protein, partial [Gemmatales bacterium]|nr:sugar phosphate isomerase/epimerase family protein [Gemmatales bacterium]